MPSKTKAAAEEEEEEKKAMRKWTPKRQSCWVCTYAGFKPNS
jgi:hypothetical protein